MTLNQARKKEANKMNKRLRIGLSAIVIAGVASMVIGTDGCNCEGSDKGIAEYSQDEPSQYYNPGDNEWPIQYVPYTLFME